MTCLIHLKQLSKARCTFRILRCLSTRSSSQDATVNAFASFMPVATVDTDAATTAAAKPGPLSGLPIAVKDNICTRTLPTTCASAMLKDFHAGYNATVVNLLENAGARIIGKTNCDEFGMGSLNLQSVFGPVINPFQPTTTSNNVAWEQREQRSAGGSSGGSAAAVASGQCVAALATDTGGSTRLPASYCGVVGLKPSYGLLSRWGVVSFADSLDTVGVIASTVDDVRRVFKVVSQYDKRDPTSIPPELRRKAVELCAQAIQKYIPTDGTDLQGLRIGIPQEYFPKELEASLLVPLRQTLEQLKARGASLVPVSMPSTVYALSTYYVLASAEASSNMARYDGVRYGSLVPAPPFSDKTRAARVYAHSRSAGFGKEVKKRILLGTYALTADAFDNYYLQAQHSRNLVRKDFDDVFRIPNIITDPSAPLQTSTDFPNVDVLLHLSAIRTAPPLSEAQSQGIETYVQDVLTVPASLAGVPAISVPIGLGTDGWPIGMSLVSQWGCEDMVFRLGEIIETMVKKK